MFLFMKWIAPWSRDKEKPSGIVSRKIWTALVLECENQGGNQLTQV